MLCSTHANYSEDTHSLTHSHTLALSFQITLTTRTLHSFAIVCDFHFSRGFRLLLFGVALT